jgi:two-component system chemotaxis sensor kinase CheA
MTMATDILEQMRSTFRAEALDLLIELDSALLSLEVAPDDSSLVNRVFRAIHTIKGSGAMAGYAHLAGFAHKMEEAFDLARDGRLAVTPDLVDCGLKACDVIRLILDESAEGGPVLGEQAATDSIGRLLPVSTIAPVLRKEPAIAPNESLAAYKIIFKPNREIFYSGMEPAMLLDDLREMGNAHITAHVDQVPLLSSLEPTLCYLWWDILLVTDRGQEAVEDVFVFVDDGCHVRIELLDDQAEAVSLLGSVPPDMMELFLVECQDQVEGMEQDALALELDPVLKDILDSLFRHVHSIKGNAGVLLDYVQAPTHPLRVLHTIAHGVESLLDPFRELNAEPLPAAMIRTVLETCDAIRIILANLGHNDSDGTVSQVLLDRLEVKLHIVPASPGYPPVDIRETAFLNTISQCLEMIEGCLRSLEENSGSASVIEIYQRGLRTLSSAAQYQKLPGLEDPMARQLQILDTAAKGGEVISTEERSALSEAFQALRSALEQMPVESGATNVSLPAVHLQATSKPPVDRPTVSASPSTIRIDQTKLDRLITVVGELLVARGAIPLLIQKMNDGEDGAGVVRDLKEVGSSISRIADELQNSVMSIRMLPVKTVFQRFPRLVRDLARSLGKEVRLVMEGEGIELDKTILEQIGDPLVHVVRNSVDHGFELPEERLKKGKEAVGLLVIRAIREAGSVSIEITDDGRGLDAGALKRKAVDKGLLAIDAADAMSDEAAYQLVFLPGLSTAAKVTDVSGRGVGMDVVQSNVRNLQGTIEIRSKLGQGTTLLIKLPTSLMVSKGILLEAGGQEYILPLTNIRDMVKIPMEKVHRYRDHTLAQIRGTVYSMFSLADVLGLTPAKLPELSVAIVETGIMRYGLTVDRFLTEVEVLVKPLMGGLEQCKEFQGAAIMGDGRVVLVLNALECHSW